LLLSFRPRPAGAKPCRFDPSVFGPCAVHPYGYDRAESPCVVVKLNKIFGLVPEPYAPTDDLPEEIPEAVRTSIKSPADPRRVYIECHGENPADVEALEGKIRYYPAHQGIPLGYFPHQVGSSSVLLSRSFISFPFSLQNKANKVSPAVAVRFDGLPEGQLLHVECRAWFRGVVHARKERMGLVHFEVLVDKKK